MIRTNKRKPSLLDERVFSGPCIDVHYLAGAVQQFHNSFVVLIAVVLSTVGVLIGMLVMQQPFSVIMTGTGIVALAGIVVNNSIILVATIERRLVDELDIPVMHDDQHGTAIITTAALINALDICGKSIKKLKL